MDQALAVLGWIIYRVAGLALVLLGLFFFLHGLTRFIGWEMFEAFLYRVYGLSMMAAGGYWVWSGMRLVRGRPTAPAATRRFAGGNLLLFAACLGFSLGPFLFGYRMEYDPLARAWGGVLYTVAALWLWTAVRLLRVDGVPVADLRFFIGGNVLLLAALVVSFVGAGIFFHVGAAPGSLVRIVGAVMFIIAAMLLQAVAKRERAVDGEKEETPRPDAEKGQDA